MGRLGEDAGEEQGGDAAAGPEPAPSEAPPRRRPGRFRRWLLRPLGWGLAVLAVLALALQLLLDTEQAREWGRDRARREATAALGRQVAVERVDFSLFPPSVEVWGLEIAGPQPEATPFLTVPWAEVELDLRSLERGVVHLRRVRAERPRLFIDVGPEGDNIPEPPAGRGEGPAVEVQIDRVDVDQAVVEVDHREAELSLSAAAVRARLTRTGDGLAGLAVAQEVHLRLPDAQPLDLAVAGQVGLFRDRVEVRGARLTGAGLGLQVDGQCRWRAAPADLLSEGDADPAGDELAAEPPPAAAPTARATPAGASPEAPPAASSPARLATKCLFHAAGNAEASLLGDLGYLDGLEGRLDVDGSVGWRPGATGFRGAVATPSLSLLGRRFEEVRATVAADRYGVRVGVREATWHGGRVRADVALDPRAPGRPVTVEAVVDGVALGPLLAAEKAPVRELASRVSGPLRYRFPAAEPFAGDGSASLTLAADPASSGLPLEGTILPVRIEKGLLYADSIGLRSAEQSVLAKGWLELGSGHGRFEGEVASAALAPLLDLVVGPDPAPPGWRPIAGRGHAGVALELSADGPRAELELDLEDVETPALGASTVTGHLVATRDAISGLRLDVAHGGAALLVAGRVDLGDPTRASLVLDARDCPLDDARPWIPVGLPLDGPLSGRLELELDGEASQGRVRLAVAPARLAATGGESAIPWPEGLAVDLDSLSARLSWDDRRLRIEELVARTEAGALVGSGSLDLAPDGSLDLRWRATGLDVGREPLRSLAAIERLGGRLDVEGRASGPRSSPSVDFSLRLDELVVGERAAEAPSALDVHLAGGRLSARGRLLGRIEVDGGGRLGGERPSLAFRVAASELGPVVRLFAPEAPESLGGSFAGAARVSWPVPSGPPAAELRLDELTVALGGHQLRNLEPVVLAVEAAATEIRELRLLEESTGDAIAVHGRIGHAPGVPLDLEVDGALSPRWVELVVPGLAAEGRLAVEAAIGGPAASPRIEGEARMSGGRLALGGGGFPHAIEDLDGRLLFADGAVILDGLHGRLAGGEIAFEGRVALPDGATPAAFQLGARATGLRVRYPDGWTLEGDADLAWRSLEVGSQLAGRAELRRIAYDRDVPVGFLELLRAFLRRQRLEVDEADTALAAIQVHVLLAAPGALQIRNNVADVGGSAELVLRGSLARPVLYGEAVFDAGGRLVWNGADYTVERARLTFANPYRLDPEIDLVATTEVREYDVSLSLAGTLDRLETRFTSDPPLPDIEVFQLIATGGNGGDAFGLLDERRDESEPGQSVATSAASFLYGQAASAIGERVGSLFGFDKFRIDPLTGSGDNLSTARITVGKRLSKDLFATYSVDPSSTEDQRLQIEWKLREGLALVLTQNGDETYSVDAKWEASF